jgi:hypothetical protein
MIKPADAVTARSPPAPTTAPATAAATPAPTTAATTTATTAATAATTTPATAGAIPAATPAATTATATAPAAWAEGEVVFVTGQTAYKRGSDGKLESSIAVEGAAYFWPLAHDVRPAQQSLGARGCVECHAPGAPIFDGSGEVTTVTSAAPEKWTMRQARMESTGALNVFAATYPLRPVLIFIGYLSAGVLLLVLLSYGTRGVAAIAQRRTR